MEQHVCDKCGSEFDTPEQMRDHAFDCAEIPEEQGPESLENAQNSEFNLTKIENSKTPILVPSSWSSGEEKDGNQSDNDIRRGPGGVGKLKPFNPYYSRNFSDLDRLKKGRPPLKFKYRQRKKDKDSKKVRALQRARRIAWKYQAKLRTLGLDHIIEDDEKIQNSANSDTSLSES